MGLNLWYIRFAFTWSKCVAIKRKFYFISNTYILAVIPTTTAVSIRKYITTNERRRSYPSYQSQQSTESKSSDLCIYRYQTFTKNSVLYFHGNNTWTSWLDDKMICVLNIRSINKDMMKVGDFGNFGNTWLCRFVKMFYSIYSKLLG